MPVMSYVRCLKCAYENNPQYRFCGMCGSSLPRGPIAEYALSGAPGEDSRAADSSILPPLTEPYKHSPGRSDREELSDPLSGPSFLGLSDDPQRNVSYLLEDDEPRQGRARSLIALLVILLLAAVVWVVHSKRAEDRERASQVAPPSSVSAPPPEPGTINPATPPAAGESPASGAPAAEAPKSMEATPAPASVASPAANPAAANSEPSGGSQVPPSASDAAPSAPVASSPPSASSASSPSSGAPPISPSSSSVSSPSSASVPPPAAPEPASRPPAAKPSARGLSAKAARAETKAAKRAAKASAKAPAEEAAEANHESADHESQDPLLVQGQKYLYGQGVPQSCTLAEKNLRLSAQNSNPEAQSVLGAMYATGHCVARDLPAAYRWFARASHLEPNNERIEQDLEVLWRQMTPEEKVVATRSH